MKKIIAAILILSLCASCSSDISAKVQILPTTMVVDIPKGYKKGDTITVKLTAEHSVYCIVQSIEEGEEQIDSK